MSLCESLQRFLEANETAITRLDENSREYVVMKCRIMYTCNLLTILLHPPVEERDVLYVRDEMKKMVFEPTYVGKGHQHLVDFYDNGNKEILF